MINICTKYGFDSLIISGSYGGHRSHTTHNRPRTTQGVWHKLLKGEVKKSELDIIIRASILGVRVLYLRFGTFSEEKVWYLTASENHLHKF